MKIGRNQNFLLVLAFVPEYNSFGVGAVNGDADGRDGATVGYRPRVSSVILADSRVDTLSRVVGAQFGIESGDSVIFVRKAKKNMIFPPVFVKCFDVLFFSLSHLLSRLSLCLNLIMLPG